MEERLDCQYYEQSSLEQKGVNKNFFFLNAHGEELEQEYEIPKGVRIIMFCYSKELYVCDRFERFNWEHILLDPKTSKNYCNFLNGISEYSSIRDHFCVYEENDIIRNLKISSDAYFREGLYRLPVKGYAYEEKTGTVVISEGTLMSEVQQDPNLKKLIKNTPNTHIKVDSKRVAKILLMVCRSPSNDEMYDDELDIKITPGRPLLNEIDKMRKYIKLEKLLRRNKEN